MKKTIQQKYANAYLAPLNYDRFFKKVFSDTKIAQRFIEDFLDLKIQDIKPYGNLEKRLTDDAKTVEFDYRCRVDGKDIIIDMQQWYKPDIIYRFYIYHCLNTALQLEDIPLKKILLNEQEDKYKYVKSYDTLVPVVTIIWLVDDRLNTKTEDYLGYTMLPEKARDFFLQTKIWEHKDIKTKIEEIVELITNNSKDLDFLQKNRLIFALQKNIDENPKLNKYSPWFSFAEKTKNEENSKSDFKDFLADPIFKEIMRRLLRSDLSDAELDYINTEAENRAAIERYDNSVIKANERELRRKLKKAEELGKQEKYRRQQAETEKQQAKEREQQAKEREQQANLKAKIIILYHVEKKSKKEISKILKISLDEIDNILEQKA